MKQPKGIDSVKGENINEDHSSKTAIVQSVMAAETKRQNDLIEEQNEMQLFRFANKDDETTKEYFILKRKLALQKLRDKMNNTEQIAKCFINFT